MPTTRRSSGGGRATGRQSTLSFNHRVTKSVPKSAKDLVSSKPAKQSPLAKHVSSSQEVEIKPEPTEDDVAIKDEVDEKPKLEGLESESKVKHEPESKLKLEPKTEPEPEPKAEVSEAELRAGKISNRQIDQYWRKLERERIAPRVHQSDLTVAEKVLRYWDVSSQYGPCVGITRMKRWKRAEKLGLNPPLEVLAVLQKEEAKGTVNVEKAHIDEILNSTAVGAV
ncbi:DNA polymerase delta, subunit 4-domain-containing protein [Hypomontagnella submonticulosa]|nr:DNA polymerase delta, subunit 4-domain-containing protein [Hypomontagnella submonticulosa]